MQITAIGPAGEAYHGGVRLDGLPARNLGDGDHWLAAGAHAPWAPVTYQYWIDLDAEPGPGWRQRAPGWLHGRV